MIQLNLLPDVKLEYIKAQRYRRLVLSVSALVSIASIVLLVLIISANGLQRKHLNDLSHDIASESSKLKREPQIGKILTVQNQLERLTALHAAKPATSHLFDYLNQVTPATVSISNFKIDFSLQTATITGTADALSSVNKYVDTLKFTTYSTADSNSAANSKAFSNIVLTSFGLTTQSNAGHPATYTITLAYDKNIFDITKTVTLSVPNLTSTRSELESPSALFQASPNVETGKPKGNQ